MFVWLQWVADSLKNNGELQMPAELRLLFPGAVSIDGTWRIIRAFGVIAEDAASDVESTGPEKAWAEAARGLKHLAAAAEGRIAPDRVHRNFLRRQWIRGVTAGDRGLARHYLRAVGEQLDTEWRSRQTHQLELFEL